MSTYVDIYSVIIPGILSGDNMVKLRGANIAIPAPLSRVAKISSFSILFFFLYGHKGEQLFPLYLHVMWF